VRIWGRREGMTDVFPICRRRLFAVVENVVAVDQLMVGVEHLTPHRRQFDEEDEEEEENRFPKCRFRRHFDDRRKLNVAPRRSLKHDSSSLFWPRRSVRLRRQCRFDFLTFRRFFLHVSSLFYVAAKTFGQKGINHFVIVRSCFAEKKLFFLPKKKSKLSGLFVLFFKVGINKTSLR